ncbi:DUF3482 domain-containing protein [Massilia sp. CF038]|uniref:DUF3482 domain-containing protein n=1 Tax=Massilia sp. CF038 TaxID=1881045 RepID=UPI0009185058|nr:DUF3482 domain-containing protein [Massilia sp. CF038]SHH73377.1 50S ribosome-binding GTPase [Massilia sp. CF038]
MSEHIQCALISHTNNGKTTLARTLIGTDVGEVRDAAHVTQLAESHTLLKTPEGDLLSLWDTPGFGDSVRLLRRLELSGNPIGWFLREVFDRYRDKPFWLSQQALRTAKDSADVILYLVNSAEAPQDAGYLPPEMKILAWLGKPVLVLLNQLGPPRPVAAEQADQQRWQDYMNTYLIVRAVLPLDAFARCWVHERVFYEAVGGVLAPERQAGYARLLAQWASENEARFGAAMRVTAAQLLAAAQDSEPVEAGEGGLLHSAMKVVGLGQTAERQRHDKAMAALIERLEAHINSATRELLALHRIDPGKAAKLNARVQQNFKVRAPLDKAQAGLLGAVVSGAATGLGADLMAGGLTFGAGALLGGLMGALTMAGAAWGFNTSTDRNQTSVSFADEFLRTLLTGSVLRYLAVAHFGRGRGDFVEAEAPAFWQNEVERALTEEEQTLAQLLQDARKGQRTEPLEQFLSIVVRRILARLYPLPVSQAAGGQSAQSY